MRRGILQGASLLVGHRWLRTLAGTMALVVLFASMFQAVFIPFMNERCTSARG